MLANDFRTYADSDYGKKSREWFLDMCRPLIELADMMGFLVVELCVYGSCPVVFVTDGREWHTKEDLLGKMVLFPSNRQIMLNFDPSECLHGDARMFLKVTNDGDYDYLWCVTEQVRVTGEFSQRGLEWNLSRSANLILFAQMMGMYVRMVGVYGTVPIIWVSPEIGTARDQWGEMEMYGELYPKPDHYVFRFNPNERLKKWGFEAKPKSDPVSQAFDPKWSIYA